MIIDDHIDAITTLFSEADKFDLPLWLTCGWAIDARLGKLTREQKDIDVAFPVERRSEYLDLVCTMSKGRFLEKLV